MEADSLAKLIKGSIQCALDELGLDRSYLNGRLGLPTDTLTYWDQRPRRASLWIRSCDILHLPARAIVTGYLRWEHLNRIVFDHSRGVLDLPRTSRLAAILHELTCEGRLDEKPKKREAQENQFCIKIKDTPGDLASARSNLR